MPIPSGSVSLARARTLPVVAVVFVLALVTTLFVPELEADADVKPNGTSLTAPLPVFRDPGTTTRVATPWQGQRPFMVSGYPADAPLLVVISLTGVPGSVLTLPTLPNLTLSFGYNSWTGTTISFTGVQSDVNRALQSLAIIAGPTNATGSLRVVVTRDEGAAYNPTNQHFYRFIPERTDDIGPSWETAKAGAEAMTYKGVGGNLAAITDQSQNDFITNKLENARNAWIGANDLETTGLFRWMSGPLSGTAFWEAQCATTNSCGFSYDSSNPVLNTYSSWGDDEPNNYNNTDLPTDPGEHCVVINRFVSGQPFVPGKWNDLPCDSFLSGISGYVVEFPGTIDTYDGVLSETVIVRVGPPEPIRAAFNFTVGNIWKFTRQVATSFKLRPFSRFRITLRSDPIVLQEGTVDESGEFITLDEMPENLPPGDHSVTIEGTDDLGRATTLVATFGLGNDGTITYVNDGMITYGSNPAQPNAATPRYTG